MTDCNRELYMQLNKARVLNATRPRHKEEEKEVDINHDSNDNKRSAVRANFVVSTVKSEACTELCDDDLLQHANLGDAMTSQ